MLPEKFKQNRQNNVLAAISRHKQILSNKKGNVVGSNSDPNFVNILLYGMHKQSILEKLNLPDNFCS